MTIFGKQTGLAILIALTVLLAVLPFWLIIHSVGDDWQGVVPAGYVFDSEFYIVRMIKGTQIFPFGNNPFFIESAEDFNPALSAADYIAAIPLKLGLPLVTTLIFNTVFWNLVFVIFLWLFLRNLGISANWIFWLMPIIYFSVYGAIIRPVVWQVVLPFFMFFLFGFSAWLKNSTLANKIMLAGGIAGTLYIYPYTWQISFLTLGLYFVWFLINHQWSKSKSQMQIIILALIIALPAMLYLYKIISNPLFPEFLKNIGSIKTYLPSKVSFQLARWPVINIFLWHIMARFMPRLGGDKDFNRARVLLSIYGLAIFILSMSPFITGRDGAIGDHMGRELFFWLSVSVAVSIYSIFSNGDFYGLKSYKKIIIILLVAINIIPVLKHYKRSLLQPFQATKSEIMAVQDYAKPTAWLEKYDKNPSVVWASSSIGGYSSILSKNYVLGSSDLAYQYWNTKREIQERYLVSKYFDDITPQFLNDDSTAALGHSYVRRLDDLKWKSNICGMLKFIMLNGCFPTSSSLTLSELLSQKNKDIAELISKNEKEIRPHIAEWLKKYRVVYAIKDVKNDPGFHIEKFKNFKEIYNDGRFVMYINQSLSILD